MLKLVELPPEEYKVFLPGTKFFDEKANLEAFGPASQPRSLLGVAPVIMKFLEGNKLVEGKPDFARAIDASLVKEVAAARK